MRRARSAKIYSATISGHSKGVKHVETTIGEASEAYACDIVIMNAPFSRSTGQEAKKLGVPRPMFAAFGSTDEEQRLMSQATSKLTSGTSVNRT
jgi:hypothetical protein